MPRAASLLLFCLTSAEWIFSGTGCARTPPPKMPRAVAVQHRIVGEVAFVDIEKDFVLIDLASSLYVPAPGTALRSRNAAGATAQLKASTEQKRPFIAADIVDGEPAVGDQVTQ